MTDEVANMEVDKVANMLVKIPDEGFSDVTLTFDDTMEMTLEVVMEVVEMEVDMVADEVTEMVK